MIVADDKQGAAGAKLMEEEGFESVFILDDKETYGKGLADQFQQAAEDSGIEVVGREGIDGSAPNYRSLMNKIAQAQPDAIYFGGIIENNAAQLIKDKVGAGMSNDEVAFIGPDGIFVDELLTQAGDAAEGIWSPSAGCRRRTLPKRQSRRQVREHVRRRGPTLHRLRLRGGQRDARRHRAGLQEAGGEVPDREAVNKQVFATEDYNGALGTWSFDEDGDTTLTELSIQRVENGEFVYQQTDVRDLVQ